MTAPIAFWFDFASPFAWIASTQIEDLAHRNGRSVDWRAILLGVVFRTTGMAPILDQPLRRDYVPHDLARVARRQGLTLARPLAPPGTSLACARVFHAIALKDPALAGRFARAAMTAIFGEGADLDTAPAAQAFAATLGGEAARLAAQSEAPPARDALRAATQDAIAQGVFGAPFIVVDGEPFWGQDRLPMVEAWLREGPW